MKLQLFYSQKLKKSIVFVILILMLKLKMNLCSKNLRFSCDNSLKKFARNDKSNCKVDEVSLS